MSYLMFSHSVLSLSSAIFWLKIHFAFQSKSANLQLLLVVHDLVPALNDEAKQDTVLLDFCVTFD